MLSQVSQAGNIQIVKKLAQKAIKDKKCLQELIHLIGHQNKQVAMRASWILTHAVDMDPSILGLNQHRKLLNYLHQNPGGGVKRNIIRCWQHIDLPEQVMPEIVDQAIAYVRSGNEDIAVKAFSITVLENCLKKIPDLKQEITFLLEREMPRASPALAVRIKRFIKAASKI